MAQKSLGSYLFIFQLLFLSLTLAACNQKKSTTDAVSPTARSVKTEPSYCGSASAITTGTTVSSTASFDRYIDGVFGLVSVENGIPIQYAEVNVIDAAGSIIQCGETDATGSISITIPKMAGTYTLRVYSRANNSYLKASVLNNPFDNTPYSISSGFVLDGTETSMAVTLPPAPHTGTDAGAFNILHNVYLTNQFLRENSSYSGCTYCASFTVAPLAKIYWTYGISPGELYGQPSQAISFFSPTDQGNLARGIYILGGVNGSICSDTDHYDNSVIIHEYAHFLEDTFAKSDSPGGSHSGNGTIDPRLAWSEGWANFFQGTVLGREVYRDTVSNSSCSGSYGVGIEFSLEDRADTDTPLFANEGTFREMSVARALTDAMESSSADAAHSSSDSKWADLKFGTLWKAFSDQSHGLAKASDQIRNAGLFFKYVNYWVTQNLSAETQAKFSDETASTAATEDSVIGWEKQTVQNNSAGWYYGISVTPQVGATCAFNVGGAAISSSRFLSLSNKYLSYSYDGQTQNSVVNASGGALFVYSGSDYIHYTYSATSGQYLYNGTDRITATAGTGVSLAGYPAGNYLVVVTSTSSLLNQYVFVNADGNSSNNGVRLCP